MTVEATRLERRADCWAGSFNAMASPCEVMTDAADVAAASSILRTVSREAWRVEEKFSRYRSDSVVSRIHRSRGEAVDLDDETADLLDFAAVCWDLSGGLFDITSGILRRVWRFDGSDRLPSLDAIEALLPMIGWSKVEWRRPRLRLLPGMEIDLGGIGKEYAVDRCLKLARDAWDAAILVNFGGDLAVSGPRGGDRAWRVGIEDPDLEESALRGIEIRGGALATSGDSRRYLERDGVRYSHILDPTTGWPVRDAPRSVTVAAATCLEAGMLATIAHLKGTNAEAFLNAQGVRAWCVR